MWPRVIPRPRPSEGRHSQTTAARASVAPRRAGALDRTGAPYHKSARGLKRARPRLTREARAAIHVGPAAGPPRPPLSQLALVPAGTGAPVAPPSTDGVAARLTPALGGAASPPSTSNASRLSTVTGKQGLRVDDDGWRRGPQPDPPSTTSDRTRLPAELKHISKRRKRN